MNDDPILKRLATLRPPPSPSLCPPPRLPLLIGNHGGVASANSRSAGHHPTQLRYSIKKKNDTDLGLPNLCWSRGLGREKYSFHMSTINLFLSRHGAGYWKRVRPGSMPFDRSIGTSFIDHFNADVYRFVQIVDEWRLQDTEIN